MKLLKPLAFIAAALLVILLVTALEVHYIKMRSVDVTTRFLLVGALTVNVVALLTLMFFVAKNLFRLFLERHHKILGYRFRTKLMLVFGVLTLIPSTFLFVTASGLATNYIDRILSPEMRRPLNQSVKLAGMFYDLERERVLSSARQLSRGEGPLPQQISIRRYSTEPPEASEVVKDAFGGSEGTEIITGGTGDMIRAAAPEVVKGRVVGVVVVEQLLPEKVSKATENLKGLYEDYLRLESFKEPLELNYVLILGFVTLMMVFTGLWVSLKISRGITEPIQSLAMATEKVAAGDLAVQVTAKSEDEVGLLTASFNQMVKQLKESKISLEKAYEESDKRRLYLENILDNINSGVLFLDNEGKIVTINRAACSILQVRAEAVLRKDYQEFIEGLRSEDLTSMVREMEGKELRGQEREVTMHISGRVVRLRVYVSGIRESYTSKALGILVVFVDVTDLIKAQKALAWQEMARRLAHEIKNPLTPIKLSTERLIKKWQQRDEQFGDVFEKSTRIIISEVESLGRLVDAFSRYGKMPEIHKVPTDLVEMIESMAVLYKGFSDVEIKVTAQEGLPQVELDREQFKRVLINIMDNAIKVMNGKGFIGVSVKADHRTTTIEIADTGPGIRDSEKDKLFLPYFSKTRGGTGLGLAIANNIVTDHGGRILVRDNTPRGSIFCVEIPLTQ